MARLEFEQPDEQRFPCLRLAREAMQAGGTSSAILNAANEIAVSEFLEGRIRFTDIATVIERALADVTANNADSIDVILQDDQRARDYSLQAIGELAA